MKWQLTLQLQSHFDNNQGRIDLVRENIVHVLNDWDYQIIDEKTNEFIFESIDKYMPSQEAYLRTHGGIIKLTVLEDIGFIRLLFTVDYWQDILLIVWVIIIAETTDVRAYYCISIIFLQFIFKMYRIRKKCNQMLIEMLSL